jgi:hypothetical protein
MSDRIGPALLDQVGISLSDLRAEESVIGPALRLINVESSRHDVEVPDKKGRDVKFQDISSISLKPLKPAQLVVELRPRGRIAVRKVETSYQHAVNGSLYIPTLLVVQLARKAAPGYEWLRSSGQNSDAIPGFLTVPGSTVTGTANFLFWERHGFQFLQAHDVRLVLFQPAKQDFQTAIDAVDVVGRDLQIGVHEISV